MVKGAAVGTGTMACLVLFNMIPPAASGETMILEMPGSISSMASQVEALARDIFGFKVLGKHSFKPLGLTVAG